MKLLLMVAASLTTAPALAEDPAPAPTTLTVTGEPGFDVKCHVWPRGGNEYVRFLDRSRNTLSDNAAWRLACEYKGSSHGPVTITISSPNLPCPFKDAIADACAMTLRKNGVGSFEVREKRG